MNKIATYVSNAYDELMHKVSWPTSKEIQETTGVVLVAILVLTLLVLLMDVIFRQVFAVIY
jgi:preprotein translocase subunit SecE